MKKILILASLFVAIASYGGSVRPAHAQSLTPAQAAADQQQIDVLKAELVKLQMNQGQVPAGDSTLPGGSNSATPTVTMQPTTTGSSNTSLSQTDITSISNALTALASALRGIETEVAANPALATAHQASIVAVLQGMGTTLAAIGTEVQAGGGGTSNVAMTMPAPSSQATTPTAMTGSTGSTNSAGSTGIAQANPAASSPTTAPTQSQTSPTTVTPSTAGTLPSTAANVTPQTAQASSAWSKLNWPLIIVIVLIVAAIAVWLWWDDEEDKNKVVVKTVNISPSNSSKPNATVNTMNQQMGQNRPSTAPGTQGMPMQTPMSASMANQK